jgi:WbqC-like protein family
LKIAIAQPTYLPWVGYFDLIDRVDTFVLLDTVQFEKQSWQQRNRIKAPAGLQWLTVPVKIKGRSTQVIGEVEIAEPEFYTRHLNLVRAHYRIANYFKDFFPQFSEILEESSRSGLAALNLRLVEWLMASLGIKVPVVLSSTLKVEGKRSALNLAICEQLRATKYYSAIGSAIYLLSDVDSFTSKGIGVCFQNYAHPQYRQLFPPFCPYASTLDLIFNEGPRSLEIIRSGHRKPFTPAEIAVRLNERVCC